MTAAEIRALPADERDAAILAIVEQIPVADVRAAMVANAREMFSAASATVEGRRELRKHRAIALQRLKTETEWAEVSWAAWMLRQCELALARPKRPSESAAHKQQRLHRIVYASSGACDMLRRWAFGPERESLPGTSIFDIQETWGIMSRVYRIAGGDMTKRPRR